jgi:hypothetical protein
MSDISSSLNTAPFQRTALKDIEIENQANGSNLEIANFSKNKATTIMGYVKQTFDAVFNQGHAEVEKAMGEYRTCVEEYNKNPTLEMRLKSETAKSHLSEKINKLSQGRVSGIAVACATLLTIGLISVGCPPLGIAIAGFLVAASFAGISFRAVSYHGDKSSEMNKISESMIAMPPHIAKSLREHREQREKKKVDETMENIPLNVAPAIQSHDEKVRKSKTKQSQALGEGPKKRQVRDFVMERFEKEK